jgi:hypothetical protein
MDEYFLLKSGLGGHVIKLVFSYGLKEARKFLKVAQEEYECNISAMVKDANEGKFPLPLPLRIVSKIMMSKSLKRTQK